MSASDPALLTLREAGAVLRTRELSPVELTLATLARIDHFNPTLNAYITVTREQALVEARQAEAEVAEGHYRGPLHGVPVGLKDLLWTKGVRTTAGAKILADFIPEEDATAVRRLKEAGAVVVGKLNMHEFAWGGTSINPHYGPVHNPWNPEYIPGGSSGGSGVAIAASLCTAALGSDTLGSIRTPSSFCGIVGLKPTYGRVSRYGAVPLAWSMDHVGPMARTVEDAALLLGVLAGYDSRDPASAKRPVDDYTADLGGSLKGMRLGVVRDFSLANLDPEVESAVRAAIAQLTKLGAELVEVDVPCIQTAAAAGMIITLAEASAYHNNAYPASREDYGDDVRSLLDAGSLILAVDYVQAQRVRQVLAGELQQALREVEALVMPSVPALPVKIAEANVASSEVVRFNAPFNLSGLPAVSLPCGFSAAGLPIGLSLAGRAFGEKRLLGVAHQYEQSTSWHEKRPPLVG